MNKKVNEMCRRFIYKFKYHVNVPFDVIMEEPEACERFCEIVKRSLETGVDETIEVYGTLPPLSFEPTEVFID